MWTLLLPVLLFAWWPVDDGDLEGGDIVVLDGVVDNVVVDDIDIVVADDIDEFEQQQ